MLPFKSTSTPKPEPHVIDDGFGNVLEVEKYGCFTVDDMIAYASAFQDSSEADDKLFAKEAVNRVLASRFGLPLDEDHLVDGEGVSLPYSFIEAAYVFIVNEKKCWKDSEPKDEEGKRGKSSNGKKSTGSST